MPGVPLQGPVGAPSQWPRPSGGHALSVASPSSSRLPPRDVPLQVTTPSKCRALSVATTDLWPSR